jgi:GNAT superfamily N-acetyltransferase
MPDIRSTIERGIHRGTALVTGGMGSIDAAMLLSRDDRPHRIIWLAVAPEARGRGLGSALVHAAVDRWPTGDIEVITFAADTPGAASARRLYRRASFDLVGPAEPAPDGGPRDRYVLRR